MKRHTEYAGQQSAVDHEAMRKGIHLVWSRERGACEAGEKTKLAIAAVAAMRREDIPIEPVTRAGQVLLRWMRALMPPANRYSEA